MTFLLALALAALFICCVGLFGLSKIKDSEIDDLYNIVNDLYMQVLEDKERADKIDRLETQVSELYKNKHVFEVVHKYDNTGAPIFPNKEGL